MITKGFGKDQSIITQGMGFLKIIGKHIGEVFRASSTILTNVSRQSIIERVAILKSWIK